MWIIIGIVLLIIVIAVGVNLYSKIEANSAQTEIRARHITDLSFSTSSGCIAFSDVEKKIHFFSSSTHKQVAISYGNLIRCGRLNQNTCLLLFDAMTPSLTQYQFGAKNEDQMKLIMKKMEAILEVNLSQAKNDYNSKILIPPSATEVRVTQYKGINADIPSGFWESNTYIWVENEQIHLMSKFGGLPDYKVRPNVYNPIIIDIKNIVELAQGGEVHYTTQIHGGGGGGTSIKGAIIGGVLAGEAGAIIGSRKPTDPITSTTHRIDDRATHMKVLDSNNKFFEIEFAYNDYYVIARLMGL